MTSLTCECVCVARDRRQQTARYDDVIATYSDDVISRHVASSWSLFYVIITIIIISSSSSGILATHRRNKHYVTHCYSEQVRIT